MPNLDKTGPNGDGPQTGRGRGIKKPQISRGNGQRPQTNRGQGRGQRKGRSN